MFSIQRQIKYNDGDRLHLYWPASDRPLRGLKLRTVPGLNLHLYHPTLLNLTGPLVLPNLRPETALRVEATHVLYFQQDQGEVDLFYDLTPLRFMIVMFRQHRLWLVLRKKKRS